MRAFGVHELLPVRRHASNGSLQHASRPPPRLTNTRCSAVYRSASASLVAPPTCAAVLCFTSPVLPRAGPLPARHSYRTAADVLSRLVSIGGVALALQLRLTTPLLQSFPAPNYYVSCRVSASLTHARP